MTSTNTPTGDPVTRALAAWYRAGNTDQPDSSSGLVTHDDLTYVRLVNVNGVLAVYRVRPNGSLKRLKRWPAEVADR